MDWVLVINTSVGLMALGLGVLAIWLSLYLYSKAKDSEKETSKALEAIRAQSDALQKLTGRWMDRFTRHAVEPKPADEGLMQLVQVVASLPTTILAHLQVRGPDSSGQEPLLTEIVDAYVGLYYYTALANVLGQGMLPQEAEFNPEDSAHVGIQAFIDRTASDFAHMAKLLGGVDQNRLRASSLKHLLDEAIEQWRPLVRFTSQVFEARRAVQ
ncbi:MAG: hypothetical protein NTAFB01_37120 [Nitrospira sp.]